jgi:AhpD family alkylhydroperoxidase
LGSVEEYQLDFQNVIHDLRQPTRDLRAAIPQTWAGFRDLHDAAMADGVLSGRFKELIALAIAVADGCDGCIAYHARAAALKGATDAEVAEALGVALLMAGGPASVEAPRALQAFREFQTSLAASAVG